MLSALLSFLATRQIFTGAGRVGQANPLAFEFEPANADAVVNYQISQRADHIVNDIYQWVQFNRAIINARDEPLADYRKYRRLHLLIGDSNMSEYATALKIGTTALVLDMIEDGFFDRDYSLQSPVQAIRDISHDPTLKETIKLKDGRSISALQLQQEYLEYATRYVNTVATDDESRHVVERWTDVIEKLATDPMQLERELDWVIKRQWIESYMTRNRLSWRDPKISLMDLQYHDIRPGRGLYGKLEESEAV
jgi:proteasome accessory factor A